MLIQPRLFSDFRKVEELMKKNGRGVWTDFSLKRIRKLQLELNSLKIDFDTEKKQKTPNVTKLLEMSKKAAYLRKEIAYYGSK